jgi:hypothetical protein
MLWFMFTRERGSTGCIAHSESGENKSRRNDQVQQPAGGPQMHPSLTPRRGFRQVSHCVLLDLILFEMQTQRTNGIPQERTDAFL